MDELLDNIQNKRTNCQGIEIGVPCNRSFQVKLARSYSTLAELHENQGGHRPHHPKTMRCFECNS